VGVHGFAEKLLLWGTSIKEPDQVKSASTVLAQNTASQIDLHLKLTSSRKKKI
jgi:hypothetical protein